MSDLMSEGKREIDESETHRLLLKKGENIIGEYIVYAVETSLGIPHRLTVMADKNYRVDLCSLEPFGIEFELK